MTAQGGERGVWAYDIQWFPVTIKPGLAGKSHLTPSDPFPRPHYPHLPSQSSQEIDVDITELDIT